MERKTYTKAITRRPPSSMAEGITTQTASVNLDLARHQHEIYIATLKELNISVTTLDPEEDFPDSHFVEDAAIIHNNVAILTRLGAKQRQGEVACLKYVLESYLTVEELGGEEDATVDGGDVLFIGNKVLIGISHRTTYAGAERLQSLLHEIDSTLSIYFIPFAGVLHLKNGLTALTQDTLLGNPAIKINLPYSLGQIKWLPEEESHAANTLVANGSAFISYDCPSALITTRTSGLNPIKLDMSEFRKMDGSFTCLSLLW